MLNPDLCVNSGVQSALLPSLQYELNPFGEYRPRPADLTLDQQRLLEEVTLGSAIAPTVFELAEELWAPVNAEQDPILGHHVGLYVGHVTDADIRRRSTSGGLTTWILQELLRQGAIDGVIHMKAGNPGDRTIFRYDISTTLEGIAAGAGTKYYPGLLSDVITRIREDRSKRYALVGIPSFVAEVRLLARLHKEYVDQLPFMVGLLCAHQKTTKYAEALIRQAGLDPHDGIVELDFRTKCTGQRPNQYLTTVRGRYRGELVTRSLTQSESLVGNWGEGLFKSRHSDFSEDAFNITADVSLGDAWLPRFLDDPDGNNVLVVRNPLINSLLRGGVERGQLHLEEVSPGTVKESQVGLIRNTVDELPFRLAIYDTIGRARPRTSTGPRVTIGPTRALLQLFRMLVPIVNRRRFLKSEQTERFASYWRYARRQRLFYRVLHRVAR